jgi:capsular polysaccharide export protein
MSRARSFLFLQGVCSPFFARLADRLKENGHRIYKVNFNAGDWGYWRRRSAWNFRAHVSELRDFLAEKYRKFEITDQVLFGDRRPVHRPAVDHGKAFGVRTHVFEEGYFRPHWVTLERDGVNGHSLLPRDPNWFRAVGAHLPDNGDGQAFSSSFNVRAAHDVAYHSAGFWNPLFFPRYRTHAPTSTVVEYINYARRLPSLQSCTSRDNALVDDLVRSASPFFFLPLQLGSDAQILDHSCFESMIGVLELVMASFAKHAPSETKLIIKNHPLDTGQVNYARVIRDLSERFGLTGRVHFIETGDLNILMGNARGTVTVNSTVGAISLGLNCPTIALGAPIYDLPGLTSQGGLDRFWCEPELPDAALFRCFRNTVIHTTQINGGFYSREGIALAVNNSCKVLEAECSPMEALL